jgi:hypothetical protein
MLNSVRKGGPRRLRAAWLASAVVALAGAGALVAPPTLAATSGLPVIESLSTEAHGQLELGVTIDPDGLETFYEITVECEAATPLGDCEPLANAPHAEGELAAGDEGDEVHLNVASLPPGYTRFEVVAINAAGIVLLRGRLENPAQLTVPENKGEPYVRADAGGAEWAQRSSERAVAEYHAAQQAKEEQERAAEEAAQRAAAQAAAAAAAAAQCVVPSLARHTLAGARTLLAHAHCKVGHVTYPRAHRGRLRVAGQSLARGSRRPAGAAVAIRLVR